LAGLVYFGAEVDLNKLDAIVGIILSLCYIIYHRYFKTPFDSAASPYVIRSLLAIFFAYLLFLLSVAMWFFVDWPVVL